MIQFFFYVCFVLFTHLITVWRHSKNDPRFYEYLHTVENILISTAKRCLKSKTAKKRRCKISSNKNWFDKECRFKRHELRKLSNQKHRDPLNNTLREEYHNVLKQYKNLLKHKRNEYYSNKICELENTVENSNNKSFWNCLKSMDDTMEETYTPPISEDKWMSHFQNNNNNISFICMTIITPNCNNVVIEKSKKQKGKSQIGIN